MNRVQRIAAAGMIALLSAFGTLTAAVIHANTQPSAAEQAADNMGVAIIWKDEIRCGGGDAYGCYTGHSKIYILEDMSADWTEYVIWHELAHVISQRDGLNWDEADADAYADQMTD